MKIRSLAMCALALLLPLSAAACGGKDDNNSGSRPSATEIEKGLRKFIPQLAAAPDDVVKCWAENLQKSDLPNGVLNAIADGREPEIDKDNKDDYEKIAQDSATTCVKAALPGN
ncbi:MAG: hypothetical protein KDB02_16135 [Acidimicrobiales bacterium]|nr:hypothetical protein [Acidimicrobiales bacterium]